ncbi:predicted protein [Uncinocarpus reesii 1704]|uniref:Uncharacterized protein n=1 Tax=Uncinocarpus reesii (strain UAMH 1704) TaxID=336963 RepID=C4JSA5_UNCRE|nr:uncharacterized protein UREG_05344 [Uncinocarpus reesii 1704]EEP80502.1 predicted protein [Uncinocarpus reesii 1704]
MARISWDPRGCESSSFTNTDSDNTTEHLRCRFTPRPAIKKPTRLWDRTPATPVSPRCKSHKIWKRLHSASGVLQANMRSRGTEMTDSEGDVLVEEINLAKSSGVLRITKKLCVGKGVKSGDEEWKRAFEATKFEAESFTARRKYMVTTSPVKKPSAIATLLKQSVLEQDDAELFTTFLTEARAKREAKHAQATDTADTNASVTLLRFSSRNKYRKALENLDKNSPSSSIRQASPSKLLQPPVSPLAEPDKENAPELLEGEEKPASTPSPKKRGRPAKQRVIPRIPEKIPLRRSNGTEFVFKLKTDTQQLALTTKANTKHNRGDSKLPHIVLESINATQVDDMASSSPDPSRVRRRPLKTVTWDDKNLVTFADEISTPVTDSPNQLLSGRRSSRRLASIPPQPSTPVPRKMRKLGSAKTQSIKRETLESVQVMTPPTAFGVQTRSTKQSFPSLKGTPISKRKRLTPEPRKIKDFEDNTGVEDGKEDDGLGKTAKLGGIQGSAQRFRVKIR